MRNSGKGKAVKATQMPNLASVFSPQQLAGAIKSKRTGMKLRVVDVAEALELSKQTVIKIEKGDTNVTFSNLLRVMEYLGLSFRVVTDGASVKQTKLHNEEANREGTGEQSDEWF